MHLVPEGEPAAVVGRPEAGLGIDRAPLVLVDPRPPGRARHQGRVDQRACLEHESGRVQLPSHLRQAALDQRPVRQRLPKAPDRRMVRRAILQREAAEPHEAQPVRQRRFQPGIGQHVPLLQKQCLEHHERRIRRFSPARPMNGVQQTLQWSPVNQPVDLGQAVHPAIDTPGQGRIPETELTHTTTRHAHLHT
jgi:hypothetical protein